MPGRQLRHADRAGLERHHRAEPRGRRRQRSGVELLGGDAVGHQTRADGVVGRNPLEEQSGARGEVPSRDVDPRRGERRERRLEARDLGGASVAGPPPPGDASRRPRAEPRSSPRSRLPPRQRPSTATPPRPRPVSISSSTWSSGPPAAAAAAADAARSAARASPAPAATAIPRRRGLGGKRRRDRIEHRDPSLEAGRPERDGLVEGRDAEAVGARFDERPGDRHHPVAVCVGLDDRLDENTRSRQVARHRQVRGKGVEIDLDPGRPRQRGEAGRRELLLDRAPSVGRDRRRRSGRRRATLPDPPISVRRRDRRTGSGVPPGPPDAARSEAEASPAARRSATAGEALPRDRRSDRAGRRRGGLRRRAAR